MMRLYSRDTGSDAINFTLNPNRAFQLEELRLHLSAVGGADNITVTLDAFAGEEFDTLLTDEEQMIMIGRLFPKGIVYDYCILLQGTLVNNVPIEINIPIDPNPFEDRKSVRKKDPIGTYQKINDMIKTNPELPQYKIAETLGIAPSTIVRLRHKFGEYG